MPQGDRGGDAERGGPTGEPGTDAEDAAAIRRVLALAQDVLTIAQYSDGPDGLRIRRLESYKAVTDDDVARLERMGQG
jgi:hypothetical protein